MLYCIIEILIEVKENSDFTMDGLLLLFLIISATLNCLILYFASMVYRRKLLELYYSFKRMDLDLGKIGFEFNWKPFHLLTLTAIYCSVVTMIGLQFISQAVKKVTFWQQLPKTLFYGGTFFMRETPIYHVMSIMVLLGIRLRYLHGKIRRMRRNFQNVNDFLDDLEKISRLHLKICMVATLLNDTLVRGMLGTLVNTSIAVLLYILCYFQENCQNHLEMMFWAFSNISVTWTVIVVCHYVSFLSEETGRIIASLDIPIEDEICTRKVSNLVLYYVQLC